MSRTFVIAEVGSNWRDGPADPTADLSRAIRLIAVCAEAGADAVKFQAFAAAPVYAIGAGQAEYLSSRGETRSINEVFNDLALPPEWYPILARECENAGVEFMASVFSPADVDAVDPFVKRHKIASYELGDLALARSVAKKKKPVILSTGAATWEEIRRAAEYMDENGVRDLTLLHCVAAYPAPPDQCNLCVIGGRSQTYGLSWLTGLSDHTTDPILAPVIAVARGATAIEKHVTLDRRCKGPDHAFAVMPDELRGMIQAIRTTEIMLGSDNKIVMPCEEALRIFACRAVQATREIVAGEKIEAEGPEANVAPLRPGMQTPGVSPATLPFMRGYVAKHKIPAGAGVRWEDLDRALEGAP